MKPSDVFEKLQEKARLCTGLSAYPDWEKVKNALKEGKEIPDSCLPGRLLAELTEEERNVLKNLTSKDIDVRPDAIG